jgi:hypothetical protein
MDFDWGSIESTCGQYNFAAYDTLLATMVGVGVRPYWIMDYGNACYPAAPGQPGNSCTTTACIAAYVIVCAHHRHRHHRHHRTPPAHTIPPPHLPARTHTHRSCRTHDPHTRHTRMP